MNYSFRIQTFSFVCKENQCSFFFVNGTICNNFIILSNLFLFPTAKTDQLVTVAFSCVFSLKCSLFFSWQVVMPTVEADVAFGLGKYPDMSLEEVKSRVVTALDAVGMRDYMQVGFMYS